MIIALLLSIAAVLFLCWLLFTLASLALPFFAAMAIGLWAHHAGAGIAGAIALLRLAGGGAFGRRLQQSGPFIGRAGANHDQVGTGL